MLSELIVSCLIAAAAALIWCIVLFGPMRKYAKQHTGWHIAGIACYCVYLGVVNNITGTPNVITTQAMAPIQSGNLVPFAEYGLASFAHFQYYANIILFVPLGFFLPVLWGNYRQLWKVVLCGLGMSLFIECSQLFTLRATDVDDLIMNTLGAACGYLFYKATSILAGDFYNRFTLVPVQNTPFVLRQESWSLWILVFMASYFLSPLFYSLLY